MTTPTDRKAAATAPTESERLHHVVEMRYETRIRVLEEEKAALAAQLAQRFTEMGTLTRMMQERQAAAAARETAAATREAELARQVAYLHAACAQMEQSTSWRITRPLRWIARRLHKG